MDGGTQLLLHRYHAIPGILAPNHMAAVIGKKMGWQEYERLRSMPDTQCRAEAPSSQRKKIHHLYELCMATS